MKKTMLAVLMLAAFGFGIVGCSPTPKNEEKVDELQSNVARTLDAMRAEDPTFGEFLNTAYGYAVFPTIGKGGLIVGGSYGKGEVFEQGRRIGYADMTQATVGAQIGGQEFAEVIVFENKAALDKFRDKEYAFTAQVSAVAIKSGAAKNARFRDGVAVFTYIKGGLMAEAAVGGQRFRFRSL